MFSKHVEVIWITDGLLMYCVSHRFRLSLDIANDLKSCYTEWKLTLVSLLVNL